MIGQGCINLAIATTTGPWRDACSGQRSPDEDG